MPIKTKRWNDPKEPDDGYRLLICRYRPRGVRKADESWDAWCSELGPSRKLHGDFYGKNGPPIGWSEYCRRYLEEMNEQHEIIAELAGLLAEGATITLLCSSACTDASHCHRTLLRNLIERQIEQRGNSAATGKTCQEDHVVPKRVELIEGDAGKPRRGRRKKSSPHSPA